MDLQLVNKGLSEAKLFRYSRNFGSFTGRQVADLLFLNIISLQLLSIEKDTHTISKKYAQRTVAYGSFALFRTAATDLYMLTYQVLHPANDHCNIKNPIESKRFLGKLKFEQGIMIRWLRTVAQGQSAFDWTRQFFYRLESQLQIKDSRYKRWRRLISTYDSLTFEQRNVLIAQITFEIKRIGGGAGRGSELLTYLEPFKQKRGKSTVDKTSKKNTKVKGDNVDKYKRARTGIGAIASYWAGGKKR